MNLSGLLNVTTQAVPKRFKPINKSPLSEINTGDNIYVISDNGKVAFNPMFISLLDRYLSGDVYCNLSIEQKRFIDRFLYEANQTTMDEIFVLLDKYLGNKRIYKEVE